MDDRIQRFLDGEIDLDALDPDERREAALHRRAIREALGSLPSEAAPDVAGDVMARIRELDARDAAGSVDAATVGAVGHTGDVGAGAASDDAGGASDDGGASTPVTDLLGWLWRPRPVRIRPAWALAAALLAGVLLYSDSERPPSAAGGESAVLSGGTAVARTDASGLVPVRFRIEVPEASSVRLVGDFTGWQEEHGLREIEPGVWSAVVSLPPGVHEYAYVVDGGRWLTDPMAETVDDGFGGSNSRIAVLAEGAGGAT